jgi:hypothetical protein
MIRSSRTRLLPLGYWLLCLVVMLRILIAPGTMVTQLADGSSAVVLCTGKGALVMHIDAHGNPVSETGQRGTAEDASCAFASLNPLSGDVDPPALPPRLLSAGGHILPWSQILATSQRTSPPPSTGPPVA